MIKDTKTDQINDSAENMVSASKHGVVQKGNFPAIMHTSLFEAFFSASFQAALLR
ncbi:hypothetical protein ACTQWG_18545 [Blautia sp. HCP3S3_H10_1]|uniref:hypothetical protein n=1 Tax=unclassified Blautia TaxID=2648079 RepID=UPI003F8FCC26